MNSENNKIEVLIKLLIGVVIVFLICLLAFIFWYFKKDFSNNAFDKPNGIDTTNVLCKAKEKAIAGQFMYGDEYICELGDGEENTFFVLSYSGSSVELIMDSNIDAEGKAIKTNINDYDEIDWISKEDYISAGGKVISYDCEYGWLCSGSEYGPITATNALRERTSKWTKLNQSQITLPSAEQLSKASYKSFNADDDKLSWWLCDYMRDADNNIDYVDGYWTSTSSSTISAEAVDFYCHLTSATVSYSTQMGLHAGIRPIITIPKTQLG